MVLEHATKWGFFKELNVDSWVLERAERGFLKELSIGSEHSKHRFFWFLIPLSLEFLIMLNMSIRTRFPECAECKFLGS